MAELTTCIKHPDRIVISGPCSTQLREGFLDPEVCVCCDECRATCLATPHGHGGTPAEEWLNGVCLLCGLKVP